MTAPALPESARKQIEFTSTCWLWRGYVRTDGYGGFSGGSAHRRIYEQLVGPIPEGLHIDHLCMVPLCVNPAHLEPVTEKENNRRRAASQTHCKRGHQFTPDNTYVWHGKRHCRSCSRQRAAAYRAQREATGRTS